MTKRSISEIRRQISDLQAEILRRTEEAKTELRIEFDAKLADAGLELTDLYPEFAAKRIVVVKAAKATQSADPKYRDPQTGATWSGRGRAPQWVQAILENRKMSLQAFKVTSEFRT